MSATAQKWRDSLALAWWSAATPLINSGRLPVPEPFQLTYVVTHRCNSRCVMCRLWQESHQADLSVDDLRHICAGDAFRAVTDLTITGGEPTLRPDLPSLLAIVAGASPRLRNVTLATNGFDPERTVEQITSCLTSLPKGTGISRFSVQVSLDGIGVVHDRVRGVPGFFERVMRTLNLLQSIARTDSRLALKLSSTVQPSNLDSVPDLLGLAARLRLPIRFGALVLSTCYYRNDQQGDCLRFSPEQARRASDAFGRLALEDPGANVTYYYRDAARMVLGEHRRKTCMMGYYGMVLEHDGSVYPCVNCEDRVFGSLAQRGLPDIWRSSEANAARRKMRRDCCPTCTSICYTLPGDPLQLIALTWARLMRRKATASQSPGERDPGALDGGLSEPAGGAPSDGR